MRIIALAIAAGMVLYPPITVSAELPVIDVHLHVWDESQFPSPPPMYPDSGLAGAQSQQEMIDETLAQMEEHNVVLGLIHDDPQRMKLLKKRAPEQFQSYPYVFTDDFVDHKELGEKFESGEWQGIGEVGTQYHGLKPTDAFLWPYYEIANRHQVPIFWHTGLSFPGITRSQPKFRADYGRPLHWEDVLVRYPDLRAVLVHAGHPYLDEIIAVLGVYPNVYVDTGAIVHVMPPREFYRYYGALIDAGFSNRILFGSDQMSWPGAIGYGIDLIRAAPWAEDVKRDILYNNAARFLQLSEEEIASHHRH